MVSIALILKIHSDEHLQLIAKCKSDMSNSHLFHIN